ncbi:DUF4241 domain-containing protein [Kitasatospora sp. NPDC086801]|uniref:DUF4241 domain-containing protein n=1 Tax=Kitasatospora sp. NPDC086801 TaxID=3364066 RepID=UPI003806F7A7
MRRRPPSSTAVSRPRRSGCSSGKPRPCPGRWPLRPCDDTRLLGEGEAYGFGTDGAMGAFADAGAWGPLQRLSQQVMEDNDPEAWKYSTGSAYFLRTREPGSGAELVAFAVGSDGVHPVWVGRSADGDVVGVVVLVEGMPDLMAP